jgi:hypothetical protein
LVPDLRPGDCIIASAVADAETVCPTDPTWSQRLYEAMPNARHGTIAGVNAVVATPAAKQQLHARTGALAVDMESHLVSRAAAAHKLAFAAIRVVLDPVHRPVPMAAVMAMGVDGNIDLAALVREIVARPSQLSTLLRIAADAYLARSTLIRLRELLGPLFGCEQLAGTRSDGFGVGKLLGDQSVLPT